MKTLFAVRQPLRGARLLLPGVVALALAFSLPPQASGAGGQCSAAPAPGAYRLTVPSGGLRRTAVVYMPTGIPAGTPVPLLLALHGAYGNGSFMQTYSGFSNLADRYGFIVAYPSAPGNFWNISADPSRPDDVAFLSSLITTLKSTSCIDSTQVFATGVSNGGGMVALLACQLSTELAAIATVAGNYTTLPPCHLARPLPLLEIHGTSDQIAPYPGGRRHSTANGLPPFVDAWAQRDGCVGGAPSRSIAPHTVFFRWRNCAGGSIVEHIRIVGGRHQWPGATPPDPGPAATICASCTIWNFFSMLAAGRAQAQPPYGGAPI